MIELDFMKQDRAPNFHLPPRGFLYDFLSVHKITLRKQVCYIYRFPIALFWDKTFDYRFSDQSQKLIESIMDKVQENFNDDTITYHLETKFNFVIKKFQRLHRIGVNPTPDGL